MLLPIAQLLEGFRNDQKFTEFQLESDTDEDPIDFVFYSPDAVAVLELRDAHPRFCEFRMFYPLPGVQNKWRHLDDHLDLITVWSHGDAHDYPSLFALCESLWPEHDDDAMPETSYSKASCYRVTYCY